MPPLTAPVAPEPVLYPHGFCVDCETIHLSRPAADEGGRCVFHRRVHAGRDRQAEAAAADEERLPYRD